MSAADVAWAVDAGLVSVAAVGAFTYLADRLIDRLRVVPGQPQRAVSVPAATPETAPKAVAPLPAGEAAERRAEFARLRTEDGKSVTEARLAVGIAERTARRYESERLGRPGAA